MAGASLSVRVFQRCILIRVKSTLSHVSTGTDDNIGHFETVEGLSCESQVLCTMFYSQLVGDPATSWAIHREVTVASADLHQPCQPCASV